MTQHPSGVVGWDSIEPSDVTPQLRITKPDTDHYAAGKRYLAEAEQTPIEDWRNLDRLLRIADLHRRAAEIAVKAPIGGALQGETAQ